MPAACSAPPLEAPAPAATGAGEVSPAGAEPVSALAPANLAKARPAAPFSVTGNWFIDVSQNPDAWRFGPPYPPLKPAAQAHADASKKATAEGKVYRDDIGQCWPAGLPLIMTRYWPMAMIQLPTAIYMVSGFMNSLRIVYLDGRSHTEPDIVVRTFNGESIGHWEGDTLVVDTRHFRADHHWMDQGGVSIPAGEQLRIVERIKSGERRQAARDRVHDDRPGELGRRMEEHQALQPGGRRGHPGSVVPARLERAPAEHDVEDAGPAVVDRRRSCDLFARAVCCCFWRCWPRRVATPSGR